MGSRQSKSKQTGSPAAPAQLAPQPIPPGYYTINVLLSTILFVLIFLTATAWAAGAMQSFKHKADGWKLLVFSAVLTVVTVAVAVGFGELSRVNRFINVNFQQIVGGGSGDLATPPPATAPNPD